jgi:DNA replication and repair protein RecF
MVLKYIELQNFRLFSQIDLYFKDGINLITGKNGQGKTSLLEAIHYLALTKSFKTSKDKNAVKFDTSFFNIKSTFTSHSSRQSQIRFYYSFQDQKQIYLNAKRINKFSEYIGTVPIVVLTLDDLKLSYGNPAERRKFLDVLLSQVSQLYLENLKSYRKTIQQRNALFATRNDRVIRNQIGIWNEQLVCYAIPIIRKRLEMVEFFNQHLTYKYNSFTNNNEQIRILYKSNIYKNLENVSEAEMKNMYFEILSQNLNKDIEFQTTMYGPHRDDICFLKNDKSFKDFGSQGENKTLIIVLKLLESDYLTQKRDRTPILLLDDIFGELDNSRMHILIANLKSIGQTFITTTMGNKFSESSINAKYTIDQGKILDA